MRFGFSHIPSNHFERTVRLVKEGERIGYDYAWLPDQTFHRNVYTMLTACALGTSKIHLGIGVTNPYVRHPALTAVAVGSVDEISGGRITLGIGSGNPKGLVLPLGFRWKMQAETCREAILVIRKLLSGEKVYYESKFFSLKGVKLEFKTRPDVPIYVAATGPKMLQMAGEMADGVIIGGLTSHEGLNYAFEEIRKGTEKAGKSLSSLDIVSWVRTIVTNDKNYALDLLKPHVASYLDRLNLENANRIGIDDHTFTTVKEVFREKGPQRAAEYISDEVAEMFSIAGSVDECATKIEMLARHGVKMVSILPTSDNWDEVAATVRLFGEKVLPRSFST